MAKLRVVEHKMPSHAGYSRIIPRSNSHSIEEGLQARVRGDALWMLSRQWSLGEFRAKNGGKIAHAELEFEMQDIDNKKVYLKKPNKETETIEFLHDQPFLEPLVEQEKADVSGEPPTWNSRHLDYSFAIKCGKTTLKAEAHIGNLLDWFDYKIGSEIKISGKTSSLLVLPQNVSYKGMPSPRWWEFEDSTVDLGDIKRPNLSILSMLLTEFALIYSNDWFVIPVDQKAGSLRKIKKLEVIDSFGIINEIKPISNAGRKENFWSMFTLSGGDGNKPAGPEIFMLHNTVAQLFTGEPLEEITINRDELANLVWAIEHKYYSNGEVINRDDEESAKIPKTPPVEEHPLYRIKSHIPQNWIPYMPVQKSKGNGDVILRRARTDINASSIHPQYKSRIIEESVRIHEEEVPATALNVSRYYKMIAYRPEEWEIKEEAADNGKKRLVRKPTRQIVVWLGRNKKIAAKRGYSNMKFDYLVEK